MIESLKKFPGWPSQEGMGILRLSDTVGNVKSRLSRPNLPIQKGDEADGRGPYESVVFKDPDIGVVALITHIHAPYRGTDVIVDANTSIDTAIARVKDVFHLSKKDVSWVHPASKTKVFTTPSQGKTGAPAATGTVPMSQMAAELAAKTGMTKRDVSEVLNDFVGVVVKHLKKGDKVRIKGLGILQIRNRPARMARDPATGKPIRIKASKKVAFRVAKDLKDAV